MLGRKPRKGPSFHHRGKEKSPRILISVLLLFETFVSLYCLNFSFKFDNPKLCKTKTLKNIVIEEKLCQYFG